MAPERKYSNEEMIQELQKVTQNLGKSPTWDEFDEKSEMWAKIISDRFGSWNKAKKQAELETYAYKTGGEKTKPENTATSYYRHKKEEGSCKYCEENFKDCLVFHHKKDEEKKFEVSNYANHTNNIKELKEEIHKCILVCANCHRKIHSTNHDLQT